MATLAGVEVSDDESQIKQSLDAKDSSNSSSPKQILDPVVYKLVRVEGDGRLVPATDDEVMEVEDLLEDDKSDLPLVEDTGVLGKDEKCKSENDNHTLQDNTNGLEGGSQPENAEVKVQKLNARLEYIGVMLEKVKQEEKLRLSSGSPDHSSCQVKVDCGGSEVKVDRGCSEVKVDHGCSDKHDQLPTCDIKPPNDNSLQETVPVLSPRLNEKSTAKPGSEESCLKSGDGQKFSGSSAPADGQKVSGSSAPASCSSSIPDFSLIKGDMCLDNLTTKELHETFRATFGRETSVKDKLWLKRRIAMGLTNSCDVSTSTFIIKDKKLVKKKAEEAKCGIENSNTNEIDGVSNIRCKSLPTSPTNILGDRQVVSGKRLRKPAAEYEFKCEDLHNEQISSKRVRKPTKRYIEELSDVETRECNGKWVSPFKTSDPGQSNPKSYVRPACNVGLDGTVVVTRPESLGGSGVQVPYVSRVRRGRPRENFMPLMKYHPSSMGMAAKLVKKALGVRVSRHDNDNKNLRARLPSERVEQLVITEMEKEMQDVVPCIGQQQHQVVEMENPVHQLSVEKEDLAQQLAVEMENLDSSGDNSDCNATTLPTSKGGTRRKHHRAWTLSEVVKLVEGVSRYGAGRWSEIKRLAFASYAYRTSVDLKDKWRNLLRASFAQSPADKGMKNSRKNASMPIPLPILLRVRELAEKHAQVTPDLCSGNPAVYSSRGRSVYETKSGYL